jgi:hypothetical protein
VTFGCDVAVLSKEKIEKKIESEQTGKNDLKTNDVNMNNRILDVEINIFDIEWLNNSTDKLYTFLAYKKD